MLRRNKKYGIIKKFYFLFLKDIIVDQEIKYFKNRNIYSLGQTNQKLSYVVRQAIEHNFTPIVIGGDHSLAIGSVDGSAAALSKLNSEIGLRKNFTYNKFKTNI